MHASKHDNNRPTSPYRREEALARIEAGVERVAAGLQARRSAPDAARRSAISGLTSSAQTELGDTALSWDARSAEALMRVHEAAEAELGGGAPARRPLPAGGDRTRTASARTGVDHVWLEQRLAALAASLGERLARIDLDGSLVALQRRLEGIEQRLEAVLEGLARYGDASALLMIEVHVGELNAQFAATKSELARLEVIDARLSALSQQLSAATRREERAIPGGPGEGTAAVVGDAASRRRDREPDASARDLTASLEDLLEDFFASRRRQEERSANVLQGAEDALARIADRLTAMEEEKDDGGADGLAIETDRLTDVYAAGARALGQEPAFALDAADYSAPMPPAGGEDDVAPDSGAAGETWDEREAPACAYPRAQPAPASPSPAEVRAAPERPGRRWPRMLPAVMAALFAAGYLGVDGLLARASSVGLTPPSASEAVGQAKPYVLTTQGNPMKPAPAAQANDTAPNDVGPNDVGPNDVGPNDTGPNDTGPNDRGPNERRQRVELAYALTAIPELPAQIGSAALRLAAAAGDPSAQFEVAVRYAKGDGVAEDPSEAAAWFLRAALRGNGPAQYRLGICFERGIGVTTDPERAKAWYRRAAEQGVVEAMHNLAVLSLGGDGRPSDYQRAAHWFAEAAERGLLDSQFNLALLYERGLGVDQDLREAYHWYGLAARAGDAEAARRLNWLAPNLAADELLAAEQRLRAWHAREEHATGG
jgi:Sel1 repeat